MLLREAIDSLNENRKKVIILYIKGMSIEEISQLFDWDKEKVRHVLYRGIDAIKEKIASNYYFDPEVIDKVVDKLIALPNYS